MFKRKINPLLKNVLYRQYSNIINENNICELSMYDIYKIFKEEKKDIKEIFLHNLVDLWWETQEINDYSFKQLKKIIFKTRIKLNNLENHNLFLIEERVFSIDRHIKKLEVDISLKPKETAGIKFVKAHLYKEKRLLVRFFDGEVIMTNFRIIFSNRKKDISFFWKELISIEYLDYGFKFKVKNTFYVLRIHDQVTLNNTIKNYYTRVVKKWLL